MASGERYDPAGVDAGTAEMVRVQIDSHITLPGFVAEQCQFDQLTDGGKEEWRRVFLAGLDAYFAAAEPRQADALAILRELIAGADDYRCWYIPAEIDEEARALLDAHPEGTPDD